MSIDPTMQGTRVRRGPRLCGAEREEMARRLAADYDGDKSIRALVAKHGLSYGLTRTLLREAGVTLRSRLGGRVARP